ncbi:MAG: hypothetical protein ACREIJ_08265, partial [Nitrospiraceae bacterium]
FIGSTQAIIHLYPTMPHRGDLQTLELFAKDKKGGATEWYEKYRTKYNEIARVTESEHLDSNLWNYNL